MNTTLKQLAEIVGGTVIGDENAPIHRIASLQVAQKNEITYYLDKKYKDHLIGSQAGAVILTETAQADCQTNKLVVTDPHLAFAKIARFLHPVKRQLAGIHPSAVVDGAEIHPSASIAPHVVIGAGSLIAENVEIGAGCVIGENVQIKQNTRLVSNINIYSETRIGADCVIHAGVVIGSDGFGFAKDGERWLHIPQVGRVIIGDRVEIGANTAIDRGALDDTVIANGVKLDNHIHLAHNVEIGENCAFAACVAIAGSTKVGKNCTFAGIVGITGHIEIGDNVYVTGMTPVTRSLKKQGVYSGNIGVMENKEWRKSNARFRKLDDMYKRLCVLEKNQKIEK